MKAKRVTAMLLAAVMAFSATACSSSSSSTSEDDGTSEETSDSASDETEEETEEEETDEAQEEEKELEAASVDVLTEAANGYIADEIVVGTASIDSLAPLEGQVYHAMYEVYECLFGYDGVGGELYAVLADETRGEYGGYDHEEGSTDYTVYIYDYIYDHNGNHITASDVVFSYVSRNESTSDSWDAYESVEAIDDTTVVFHFNRELTGISDFANYFYGVFIVSQESYEASASGLATEMCGTGPYKFVSFVAGSSLVLEKNDDYWQTDESKKRVWANANVETITYDIIAETSEQVIALQTGEIDIQDGMTVSYVDSLVNDYGYNEYYYSANMIMVALPNCSETSIMSDENMRLAVFYAIDNESIATAYNGAVETAYTFAIDEFSDFDESWVTTESYANSTNQELVDYYLEQAGYDGEEITLMVMGMDMFSLAGQVVLGQLTEAGINCSMVSYDGATFMSLIADDTEWDLALNCTNSYDYNATFWSEMFSSARTTDGTTVNFVDDPDWNEMLDNLILEEGHTIDNMTEWWNYAIDNAYFMPIISWLTYCIYTDEIEAFAMDYGNIILPGALVYKAE